MDTDHVRCPGCGGIDDLEEITITVDRRDAYGWACHLCGAVWEE